MTSEERFKQQSACRVDGQGLEYGQSILDLKASRKRIVALTGHSTQRLLLDIAWERALLVNDHPI